MHVTMPQVQGNEIAQIYHPLCQYAFFPSPQPLEETSLKAEYDVEKYILVVFEDVESAPAPGLQTGDQASWD